MRESGQRFSNPQIATFGLWLAGGAAGTVDTEDTAARCWELAPSRFHWDKYPDFPDKGKVRSALEDAKKPKNGAMVVGTGKEGWILTHAGIEWVRSHQRTLDSLRGPSRSALPANQDAALRRVRSHPIFAERKPGDRPNRYAVADLADTTADAPIRVIGEKLQQIENTAALAGDKEVEEFVKWLKKQLT